MVTIEPDSTVSSICVEYPQATKVFARHNIDFCCGGNCSLSSACEASGLDVESILSEIHQELSGPDSRSGGDSPIRLEEEGIRFHL